MARTIQAIDIAGPVGRLEALLEEPDGREPHTAVLVCHPHPLFGGTMHNKVVYRMARALRRWGGVVLRFNFRGVGRSEGEHAHLEGEIEDAQAALDWLRARYPELPFALAGFSFGSRVITRLGCGIEPEWMLACGFPTRHGPAEYLETCAARKIFVQSTQDQYGPRAELETAFDRFADPKAIHWVEAGDHFFAGALDQFESIVSSAVGVPS